MLESWGNVLGEMGAPEGWPGRRWCQHTPSTSNDSPASSPCNRAQGLPGQQMLCSAPQHALSPGVPAPWGQALWITSSSSLLLQKLLSQPLLLPEPALSSRSLCLEAQPRGHHLLPSTPSLAPHPGFWEPPALLSTVLPSRLDHQGAPPGWRLWLWHHPIGCPHRVWPTGSA